MKPGNPERMIAFASLVALMVVAGCGGGTEEAPQPDLAAELPPGHPSLDQTVPNGVVPPVEPGMGIGARALVWNPPEDWVEATPSNSMRKAQYKVPGSEGDGECVVFYFGPGQGGDATANAVRWANQFTTPDGQPGHRTMTSDALVVGEINVLTVEVAGSYAGGGPMMGGTEQSRPGYMLLGAIAAGPDANWFFKLTGPQGTIEENRETFEAMIGSLRPGGAEEPVA